MRCPAQPSLSATGCLERLSACVLSADTRADPTFISDREWLLSQSIRARSTEQPSGGYAQGRFVTAVRPTSVRKTGAKDVGRGRMRWSAELDGLSETGVRSSAHHCSLSSSRLIWPRISPPGDAVV